MINNANPKIRKEGYVKEVKWKLTYLYGNLFYPGFL